MSHLKVLPDKILLVIFLLLNPYLLAEEESSDSEKEEKQEVYIEEMVEEFEEFKGFFVSFRDPKTNDIYLKVTKDQLDKEFIYFSHVINGVVAARRNKGSYLDNGVFNFTTPPKNENHVMFRVTAPVDTSGIALAHATYVQLTFSQVDYNIGGGWDASTNSFKPPIAGYYQLQAQCHLNSAVDTQQMGIFWRRNESGSSSGDFGDEIARCPYSRHVSSGLTNDDLYASSIDSKIIMYFKLQKFIF